MKQYRQKGVKTLVFDFDGTLARQTLDFSVMRREALAALARHIPVPDRPDLPVMEMLTLLGEDEKATAGRQAALNAVRDVEIQAARESALFPFVRPMIAALDDLGLSMGVVTRNCREAVCAVFPDIEDHCVLVTRDDTERVKPDPAHLFAALDMLHVAPSAVLMVGDHPMDIEVGKRAGTLTAGVATGRHDLNALAACTPDFAVQNGEELLRLLEIIY